MELRMAVATVQVAGHLNQPVPGRRPQLDGHCNGLERSDRDLYLEAPGAGLPARVKTGQDLSSLAWLLDLRLPVQLLKSSLFVPAHSSPLASQTSVSAERAGWIEILLKARRAHLPCRLISQ